MNQETLQQFASAVNHFVHHAYHNMMALGIDRDDLRIAFPNYLISFFIEGCLIDKQTIGDGFKYIHGIECHATWENAITVYYTKYPARFNNTPVFRMEFTEERKEHGLTRMLIIDLAEHFKFQIG